MAFTFNHNYDDHEQVREFLPAFSAIREGLEERGEYPYNASFEGLIPGIVGPDEGTAIYLLQGLYRLEEEAREIAELRQSGFETLAGLEETTRYAEVIVYQPEHYVGGGGLVTRFENARIIPRDGRPYAILPKGKRTNGYLVVGEVLTR